MATLLIVALQPRSAGRHHHTKLWEDGEGLEDWDCGKLSLQTVGSNALWEPRTPREARRGINQTDARDQRSTLCCHTCPTYLPVIDWFSLSIDLSCFSVISHLWIHHGLKGDHCFWAWNRNHKSIMELSLRGKLGLATWSLHQSFTCKHPPYVSSEKWAAVE